MCLAPAEIFPERAKEKPNGVEKRQHRAVDDEVSVARDPIAFNGEKFKRKNVENFDIFNIEKGKSEVALGESKN